MIMITFYLLFALYIFANLFTEVKNRYEISYVYTSNKQVVEKHQQRSVKGATGYITSDHFSSTIARWIEEETNEIDIDVILTLVRKAGSVRKFKPFWKK